MVLATATAQFSRLTNIKRTSMFSFLVDMRRRGLNPWLDDEGYIRLAYRPDEAYFDWLKANKHHALTEFRIERAIGATLDKLCPDSSCRV